MARCTSELRDREVVVLDVASDQLRISKRIKVSGNPNRMLLDRSQERLIVALDNSDSVAIIDTTSDRVEQEIDLNDRFNATKGKTRFTGSHPNSLALSPDEDLLFVTMGGTNSVAVVPLGDEDADEDDDNRRHSMRIGHIPTGWYPTSVSVSADGSHLYVVNAISPAGATNRTDRNQDVLQQREAGLLTLPMPSPGTLGELTRQVLFNNGVKEDQLVDRNATMAFLGTKIKHVIYLPQPPPLLRDPRSAGVQVFYPAATGLRPASADPLKGVSDQYYREYGMKLPDYWRFKEWDMSSTASWSRDRCRTSC